MTETTTPETPDLFVPPAADGLPLAALDSATEGASALDASARTPYGRNLLAHALVQLDRDGWLRAEPTAVPFGPADRPALLDDEAALIELHCPDHGPQDQGGVWMDCHCTVAEDMRKRAAELRRKADEARQGESTCPHPHGQPGIASLLAHVGIDTSGGVTVDGRIVAAPCTCGGRTGGEAQQPETQADDDVFELPGPDVVAYRNPDRPSVLLCREHGDGWWGLTPLTSDDLPDGGTCTYGDPADPDDVCGTDVLIVEARQADTAGEQQ